MNICIDVSYTPLMYNPTYDCSNILLIDCTVEDYKEIVNSVNSNTMAIVYSYSSTTEDLSNVLSNFTNISRIGFVFYSNSKKCPVTFLDNKPFFNFDSNLNVDISSENLLFLTNIFEKYNIQHVDYLACNTLNYKEWDNYYSLIQNTNTIIGASNDKTGNIKYGGDWLLENTCENIESIYFTSNIEYYKYLFDIVNIGNNPTGIKYKFGTAIIDICNNFSSINSVTNPLYNGSAFSSGFNCYYTGIKYDLSNLYYINPTLNTDPSTFTNLYTTYNSSKYDLSYFFNKNTTPLLFSSLSNNSVTKCNGCYSLKLLVSTYSGPVITIKRVVDSQVMSFYSTRTGNLTNAPNGSGTTIAEFLFTGSGGGNVDTWYDQSGKGNHALDVFVGHGPSIDITKKCLYFSANQYLDMPLGTIPTNGLNGPYSFLVKHGISNNPSGKGGFCGAGTIINGSPRICNTFRLSGNNSYASDWDTSVTSNYTWNRQNTNVPAVAAVTFDGGSRTGYSNTSYISSITKSGVGLNTYNGRRALIGDTPISGFVSSALSESLQGEMYSLLIFSTALPQSDINVLNTGAL